jgi:DNA-binding NarL/FixJ family response regulator
VSVLAGHDDDVAATRALELGAEDYLLKDEVTPHSLARSIENVADKFDIRRQLDMERAVAAERKEHLDLLRAELDRAVEELSRRSM